MPDLYDFLEAESYKHTIRLKVNAVLQEHIIRLLKSPVGRPPNCVQRFLANFSYQAGLWNKKCRVVAKVKWYPGELYHGVSFTVTNLTRPANRVATFYNQRGTYQTMDQGGQAGHQRVAKG